MGWVLVLVGAVVAVIGYAGGLSVTPQSAPQQTVQELRFVHGALGLCVFALGFVVIAIGQIALNRGGERAQSHGGSTTRDMKVAPDAESTAPTGKPEIEPGMRVAHARFGTGTVIATDRNMAEVDFDDGTRNSMGFEYLQRKD